MKITLNRFLIFLSIVFMAGLMLQQCWQRKADAEKWLYLFDEPAREYAGRVLGADRGTGLLPPEPLSDMEIRIYEDQGYVEFSSSVFSRSDEPPLHMAFAPQGPPPEPAEKPGLGWVPVRDGWYQLQPVP